MLENSLPIYWGNPLIGKEFNTRSFLNYHDYKSDEALIERIIEIDRNDELYLAYLREPFVNRDLSLEMGPGALLNFFKKIVSALASKTPVAGTYKRHIHEVKRKSGILGYELKKRFGFRNFR
jgi:hypothetical protein